MKKFIGLVVVLCLLVGCGVSRRSVETRLGHEVEFMKTTFPCVATIANADDGFNPLETLVAATAAGLLIDTWNTTLKSDAFQKALQTKDGRKVIMQWLDKYQESWCGVAFIFLDQSIASGAATCMVLKDLIRRQHLCPEGSKP